MAKKYYVYSTLTNDQAYTPYKAGGGDLPIALPAILIKGGANVPDGRLVTPQGVVTSVTADELATLEENHVFKIHKENGFITVSESEKDANRVAETMTSRSQDAPLVDGDYDSEDETAPKPIAAASSLADGKPKKTTAKKK